MNIQARKGRASLSDNAVYARSKLAGYVVGARKHRDPKRKPCNRGRLGSDGVNRSDRTSVELFVAGGSTLLPDTVCVIRELSSIA